MKTISRYIMTLALLLTAVTGAWAQEETLLTTITPTGKGTYSETTAGVVTVTPSNMRRYSGDFGWLWSGSGSVTVEAKEGYTITRCVFKQNSKTPVTITSSPFAITFDDRGDCVQNDDMDGVTSIEVYGPAAPATPNSIVINGTPQVGDKSISLTYYFDPANVPNLEAFAPTLKVKCDAVSNYDEILLSLSEVSSGTTDISLKNLGEFEAGKTYDVCFAYNNGSWVDEVFQSFVPAEPPIDVTINDTKTEATMESMPTYDVNFNYELVRDMSVQMQAQVGDDATKQPRYRVKKNEQTGLYEPAEMDYGQVLALFSVNDLIENTTLAPKNYLVSIYAVDDEGNPTGEAMDFTTFTFAPGRYCVTASAELDAPYDGTTAPSNIFELFQGYEVAIPAGEFATYYKDEALYVEDEDAQLYTITSVGNETATATELTVAAANTPLLVKNNAAEAKTILLIPTITATPDDVTPYEGFKGTLEATQIAASTATQNNYALNGKEFVWVMDAIDIAANRAWLEIPATTTNSRALTIVFGDVTGLTTANIAKAMNGDWYDLNGRKLQAAPTKKGVYILNGKKVVVK